MKVKSEYIVLPILFIAMVVFGFGVLNIGDETISTNASVNNNEKIEWGLKRETDHKQPDLGSKNLELMKEYNGIAMGNDKDKFIYLTFDLRI